MWSSLPEMSTAPIAVLRQRLPGRVQPVGQRVEPLGPAVGVEDLDRRRLAAAGQPLRTDGVLRSSSGPNRTLARAPMSSSRCAAIRSLCSRVL